MIAPPATSESRWREWLARRPLPLLELDALVGGHRRVVIVAPHPDDEVLMAGGLIQALAQARVPVALVAVTDGGESHPGSRRYTPHRLRRMRAAETGRALAVLGSGDLRPLRLHLPDRHVAACEPALHKFLHEFLTPGDICVTTWCDDGHVDHDACGRAMQCVSRERRIDCLQAPIWAWQRSAPGARSVPWARATALRLSPRQRTMKAEALHAFRSQVLRDRSCAGTPVLSPRILRHFDRPFEVFFR